MLSSDAERGTLLQQLAAKRWATDDRWNVFQDRLSADQHLLVPYRTRFNSTKRVSEAHARYRTAWDTAAEQFDTGVVVTLTTDPVRFDGLLEATETLMKDVGCFKSWLSNRFDGTPKNIVVPEFTDSGLPHIHLVLFDIEFLSHTLVSHYWGARRNRGEVIWVDSIRERGGRWIWANGRPGSELSDDRRPAKSRGPQAYLGKTLTDAMSLAESDAEDVQAAASALRATDVDVHDGLSEDNVSDVLVDAGRWWKLALYFATDTRFFTCSPSLKPDDDNDGLPHVTRWEYVGTARFGDLPGHVQRTATMVRRRGRPPPVGDAATEIVEDT